MNDLTKLGTDPNFSDILLYQAELSSGRCLSFLPPQNIGKILVPGVFRGYKIGNIERVKKVDQNNFDLSMIVNSVQE